MLRVHNLPQEQIPQVCHACACTYDDKRSFKGALHPLERQGTGTAGLPPSGVGRSLVHPPTPPGSIILNKYVRALGRWACGCLFDVDFDFDFDFDIDFSNSSTSGPGPWALQNSNAPHSAADCVFMSELAYNWSHAAKQSSACQAKAAAAAAAAAAAQQQQQ